MFPLKSLRWMLVNHKNMIQCSSICMFHSSQDISYDTIKRRQRRLNQSQTNHPKFQEHHGIALRTHNSLLKDVCLPCPSKDEILFWDSRLQSYSTENLLSMVWSVTQLNDDSKYLMIELWRRMDSMSFEQILSIADILFINNVQAKWYLGSVTAYFLEIMDDVKLTPSQLTRLVFHTLDRHRETPPGFSLALEEVITRSIDSLNMNQVAVICRAFFLSQTRLRSMDLLKKISTKLIEEFDSLSDHYLPGLMKAMRYSNFIKISLYKDLGDILVEQKYLKKFRTLGQIMHISHAYASVRVSHPELFSYILNSSSQPKYKSRLKDLAKLIWSCGTLVTDRPQDISSIEKILRYLKYNLSLNETLHYPDNLVDLVNGLCFLNIHSHYLLDILFHPKSVSGIIDMSNKEESKLPQLIIIDSSVAIEYPNYTGNRLKEQSKILITSLLGKFSVEDEMSLKKGLKEAVTALQQTLGEDKVLCTRLLPHLPTADICLVWDTVKLKFLSHKEGTDQLSNQENSHCIRLAIQILSNMQTSYDGKPLGMLHMKLRQLKTLGYYPILIESQDAHSFVYCDIQSTQDFLLKTISSVVGTDLTHLSC